MVRRSSIAPPFASRERLRQSAYFDAEFADKNGYKNMAFRLRPDSKPLNLAPAIRDLAIEYFRDRKISWHTHANHALSSQVCCLNFLMPLAESPEMLALIVEEALGIDGVRMLEVETGPYGPSWFVGFEWNGCEDYLNEADLRGKRTRGSNSTSADAVVRFRHNGRNETLLIEWKYTERYGQPIPAEGNPTRVRRYKNLVFAPNGPLRNDLGLKLQEFFYEPFYQLLRQQMLAFKMQEAKEQNGDRVRVLHIAPAANLAIRKVTSPTLARFGDDAFRVFRSLLARPEDFISRSTESLFGPLIAKGCGVKEWRDYLMGRYAFLTDIADDQNEISHGEI